MYNPCSDNIDCCHTIFGRTCLIIRALFECDKLVNLKDKDKMFTLSNILLGESESVVSYFCALGVDIKFVTVRRETFIVASHDHKDHRRLFVLLRALWHDIHEFCPHVYHTKIVLDFHNKLSMVERC